MSKVPGTAGHAPWIAAGRKTGIPVMRRVAALSIRHKWLVVSAWLMLALVGGLTANATISRMDYTYATPGQPGYEANLHITQRFGVDPAFEPTLAVLHLPPSLTMGTAVGQAAAQRTFAAAARPGVVSVADYANTGNPKLITDGGRTTWAVLGLANPDTGPGVGAGDKLGPILQAAAPRGASVTVTGFAQLLSGGGNSGGPSLLTETAIGGLLALLLLLFVYGSAIAVAPLLMAAAAIGVIFLCEFGLIHVTPVSYFLQYLIPLFGLGVAVDFSLLVVIRWREERERGLDNGTAVEAAAARAGQAVLLSGVTVAIGLLSLVLLPGSTDEAVVAGLARTGRLVTCAALIVAVSFLTLSSTPDQIVQVAASALAFGILLDAVIVRTLLVPALISLLGRWNWWLPRAFAGRARPAVAAARDPRR